MLVKKVQNMGNINVTEIGLDLNIWSYLVVPKRAVWFWR